MESWYVTAILNQCPHCQQGRLFRGWLQLRELCEICGARFERWPGAWVGPTVGGYGIGAATALVSLFVLSRTGYLRPGVEWPVALVSVAVILAVYRPIKGAWIGMMYDWGYIFPDPPKPG